MANIVWTPAAEQDLEGIFLFIGREQSSPRAAEQVIRSIVEKTDMYAAQPLLATARPEFGPSVRPFVLCPPLCDLLSCNHSGNRSDSRHSRLKRRFQSVSATRALTGAYGLKFGLVKLRSLELVLATNHPGRTARAARKSTRQAGNRFAKMPSALR